MEYFSSLQQTPTNQPHTTKLMHHSHMFPFKASTHPHVIRVANSMEEYELLGNLVWRSNTPMPIVKVLGFTHGTSTFPKIYSAQIETIVRSVKELENMGLKESLYLIQQCLFGVQALTYKYRQLDFHQIFYGLTQTGNCKVWISQNLTEYKSKQLPLPSQDIIITSIIRMIQAVCDPAAKSKLNQLYNSTAKVHNITYYQFQANLCLFANKNKVHIPDFIEATNQSNLLSLTRRQMARRANSLQVPCNEKANLGSSLAERKIQRDLITQLAFEKRDAVYESMIESRISSKNGLYKPKSIQCMLSSPSRLRYKLKLSKDSVNCRVVRTISIKNTPSHLFSNQDKSEKTSTSITLHPDNFLTTPIKTGSEYGMSSNRESLIISNSNLSQRFVKEETPSKIYDQNNVAHQKFRGNYDFGGLLALHTPEKSIKQSQYIDESGSSTIHKFDEPITVNHRNQKGSHMINRQDVNIFRGWDWQIKMTKLLTEDTHNLKQSVYCGQQKKPEPLPIKLEKLGRLGREITSMIPEGHEN